MQFTYRAEIYSYSSPPLLDKKGSDLSAIGHSVIDMINFSVPRKSFLFISIAFIVRLIANTNHSSRQCRQIFESDAVGFDCQYTAHNETVRKVATDALMFSLACITGVF